LAGLSNLKRLELEFDVHGGGLRTLEGISPGVIEVSISNAAPGCLNLAGIQACTRLEILSLSQANGLSSLQPLSGLSSLKQLELSDCHLSLEGLFSTSVMSLRLVHCTSLTNLSGVEHLPALESLEVNQCGVTSLQPLRQLGEGLQVLRVFWCYGLQEEVLELPHVQPTTHVDVRYSNVREVVLSGGVRLRCMR
jgi:Leucine-rich repeat (LRR) protein